MLQTPSRSMTVIGTASHAARYSTARFLSDDFASMAATDRVRTSCRGCRASARTPRSSSRIPKRRRAGRPWRVRPMPCYVEGGGCSNLWAAFGADRWASFTRKNSGLKKTKRPTSVVESYKTTYGHKVVVLMSVVEGRAENICSRCANEKAAGHCAQRPTGLKINWL
jgi:hypothetical protein